MYPVGAPEPWRGSAEADFIACDPSLPPIIKGMADPTCPVYVFRRDDFSRSGSTIVAVAGSRSDISNDRFWRFAELRSGQSALRHLPKPL